MFGLTLIYGILSFLIHNQYHQSSFLILFCTVCSSKIFTGHSCLKTLLEVCLAHCRAVHLHAEGGQNLHMPAKDKKHHKTRAEMEEITKFIKNTNL